MSEGITSEVTNIIVFMKMSSMTYLTDGSASQSAAEHKCSCSDFNIVQFLDCFPSEAI